MRSGHVAARQGLCPTTPPTTSCTSAGASEHNLRNVDVDIPRDALVAFTGVSGSGKSSLAFGTLYAEAQRRYFESVAPYARRLLQQVGAPHVQEITGLPPAVALQQRRGARAHGRRVGTITTLSNLLRMLYSRAGTYPAGAPAPGGRGVLAQHRGRRLPALPRPRGGARRHRGAAGARPVAEHPRRRDRGLAGRLAGRQPAQHRDRPRHRRRPARGATLKQKDRDWLLFTDEQPSVLIKPERDRIDHGYHGKFWSARKHVMHVLADSKSQMMRDRAMRFVRSVPCPDCHGSRPAAGGARGDLRAAARIAEVNALPLAEVAAAAAARRASSPRPAPPRRRPVREATEVAVRLSADLVARIEVLLDLGLGYLSPRPPLDHPVAGRGPAAADRHPAALGAVRRRLRARRALRGPAPGRRRAAARRARPAQGVRATRCSSSSTTWTSYAGRTGSSTSARAPARAAGGCSTPARSPGSSRSTESVTGAHLFGRAEPLDPPAARPRRAGCTCAASPAQPADVSVDVPLCVLTAVTGVSGSGKSTLVTQVLAEVVRRHLGQAPDDADDARARGRRRGRRRARVVRPARPGRPAADRPHAAVQPGDVHRAVRRGAQAVSPRRDEARARGYGAGRFSFNVAEGRCETCQGEGFVAVELLFLPGTYAPCPTCHGARYNAETLEVTYRGKNIADVLAMSVDDAADFLADVPAAARSLRRCATSGWATCGWASRPPSSAAARPSASSWPPSCSGPVAGTRSTCSTSRPRVCTRPTSRCCCASCTGSSTPATPSCWSSTTSTRSPPPTGSSTSARAAATRAAGWSPPGTPAEVARAAGSATAPYLAARLSSHPATSQMRAPTEELSSE